MGYFLSLPGFNLETFPFAVVRGRANIHILNVSNGYMRPLFRCKATSIYGQQPFFFKQIEYGSSFNFTLGRNIFNGNQRLQWVSMDLKPQFSETLEKIGRLPSSTIGGLIRKQQLNQELKQELAAKEEKCKALQSTLEQERR